MKNILNKKSWFYVASLLAVAISCTREELNKPIVTNSTPPEKVSGVTVVNKSGKAELTYNLPSNKDLLYVKAVYEIAPGRTREIKATNYTNKLVVDGFADTLAHEIKLYAVNTSEVVSDPVSVTVQPLTPAFIRAFRSLQVGPTFGGLNIMGLNPDKENLSIVTLVDTSGNGNWVQTLGLDNIYSKDSLISGTLRNQPPVARKYAFFVRDRWLNHSDTMTMTVTPLKEILLPKSQWNTYTLPGDATLIYPFTEVKQIFDGNFNPGWPNVLFTVETASTPQTVTIDLGQAYTFSRLKMNPFKEVGNVYYVRGNLKDFEIWGSNNPDQNGALDGSWTKLGTFNVLKPSGAANGVETAADQTAASIGWDFDFSPGLGAYRYVRIRSLSNWTGTYFMSIGEFTLWGQ